MSECQENRPNVSEDQKKKQDLDLPVLTNARWSGSMAQSLSGSMAQSPSTG